MLVIVMSTVLLFDCIYSGEELICLFVENYFLFLCKHCLLNQILLLCVLWNRCMEATPSLACANKCVFCWRHHTNPVGKSWRWKMDDPLVIVNAAIDQHTKMIKQMKGVPGMFFFSLSLFLYFDMSRQPS